MRSIWIPSGPYGVDPRFGDRRPIGPLRWRHVVRSVSEQYTRAAEAPHDDEGERDCKGSREAYVQVEDHEQQQGRRDERDPGDSETDDAKRRNTARTKAAIGTPTMQTNKIPMS